MKKAMKKVHELRKHTTKELSDRTLRIMEAIVFLDDMHDEENGIDYDN